ncbi:GAF domain-containing sensor histidine kinase [Pedobacter sp. SYP-B3415]|uniref:GAF domain-containing sensor histidine kinase n=1 Tax=Pedobacter sp. SYP-B3415 TaxID=2496641 RepID=UPI00101C85AB|nr:GAF domain-containing sensor histidine kinase [Pedobacter sp. SYP-B3415]
MEDNNPIPERENERLLSLAELDLDYSGLKENFKDLTELAARVAGTEISLINLIDSYTQWSIAGHGLEIDQMPREDSVCQHTIMGERSFEVPDLSKDPRFADKFYVSGPLELRYYFGLPLEVEPGKAVGALCVLDSRKQELDPEKVSLLQIIANEIVNRLKSYKAIYDLKEQVKKVDETRKKVAHDIRGPLAGIIGLSEIISQQGQANKLDEVLDFISMIHKSSKSLLDLADEILSDEQSKSRSGDQYFNMLVLKEKLLRLYAPQAHGKNIELEMHINPERASIPFPKPKLMQVTGNLISNAIKFTPSGGKITIDLDLLSDVGSQKLKILVIDTGEGMEQKLIDDIMQGTVQSRTGTSGEKGYGFGLSLVKHLIDQQKGQLKISSVRGQGSRFEVILPLE